MLKSCPFCGGLAFVNAYEVEGRTSYKWNAHVLCKRCKASMTAKDGFEEDAKTAERKAIEAWNKRVGDTNEQTANS